MLVVGRETSKTMNTYKDLDSGIVVKTICRGKAWLIIRRERFIQGLGVPRIERVIQVIEKYKTGIYEQYRRKRIF